MGIDILLWLLVHYWWRFSSKSQIEGHRNFCVALGSGLVFCKLVFSMGLPMLDKKEIGL